METWTRTLVMREAVVVAYSYFFFLLSLSLFSFASRTCVNDRAFVMSCRGMVVVVEA